MESRADRRLNFLGSRSCGIRMGRRDGWRSNLWIVTERCWQRWMFAWTASMMGAMFRY